MILIVSNPDDAHATFIMAKLRARGAPLGAIGLGISPATDSTAASRGSGLGTASINARV